MKNLGQDLRIGIRSLLQRPALTAAAVVTLALGIGANTAIFSLVNGVLLRPLPFPQPERLVQVWQTNPEWIRSPNPLFAELGREFPASFPIFRDWLELNPCFEDIGIYSDSSFVSSSGDFPEVVRSAYVTSGVLSALGVRPVLGRTFLPEDDRTGAPPLIVLSYGLWQSRLAGDANVLGRSISYNEQPHTVIGIMPAGFAFPGPEVQAWVTFPDQHKQRGRGSQSYWAIARLKAGISLDQARRQMEAVNRQITERTGGEHKFGVFLQSRLDQVVGRSRAALLVLMAAVASVLLIACANIANLLLVRAAERRRELAVRAALGAGRGRLLGHLLTESLTLSLAGGAAGIATAWAALNPMKSLLPFSLPRIEEVMIDYRVLLFSAGISVLTGIFIGALPALGVNRLRLSEALADSSRGFAGGRKRNRSQSILVAAEIALAFILLAGAGVLVKSFSRLTSVERGFDAARLLTMKIGLRGSRYSEESAWDSYFQQLAESLESLPGVVRVAAADNMPFSGGTTAGPMTFETPGGLVETNLERSSVSPGYFSTLGIPLIAGREFRATDGFGAEPVAIISQAAAREFYPDTSPLGWRLRKSSGEEFEGPWLSIVGVARDVRHRGLHVDPVAKIYYPLAQRPSSYRTIVIQAAGDPSLLAAAVRERTRRIDPALPVPEAVALESLVSQSLSVQRFRTMLMSLLAALAALLAILGIYGTLSYAVAQRTSEIGVRMALGARSAHVVGGVLGRALVLGAIGLAAGLGVSLVTVRSLQSFLYQTPAQDPPTFALVGLLLATAAALASILPARRATRVNPVEALRIE